MNFSPSDIFESGGKAMNSRHFVLQESSDGEKTIEYFVYRCESDQKVYFVGTLYIVQGLLLMVGSFLAFETRKVCVMAFGKFTIS